jgi:hypothetical protein
MDMQGFWWIGNKMMECSLEKGQTDIRHRLQEKKKEGKPELLGALAYLSHKEE